MLFLVQGFLIEHVAALVVGGVSLGGALAMRSYGRRLERQTRDRGPRVIN